MKLKARRRRLHSHLFCAEVLHDILGYLADYLSRLSASAGHLVLQLTTYTGEITTLQQRAIQLYIRKCVVTVVAMLCIA